MQTTLFSSFFAAKNAAQGTFDVSKAKTSPVELDLSMLKQVGGGLGPAGTWAEAQVTEGPAGTW